MEWSYEAIDRWTAGIAAAYTVVRRRFGDDKRISTIAKLKHRSKRFEYCGAGRGLWAIDVDGRLHFCHRLTSFPDYAIIDAACSCPEQIRDAIDRSPYPPRTATISEHCSRCPTQKHCDGGCWTSNLLVNGSAMVPDRVECEMRRATTEVLRDVLPTLRRPEAEKCVAACFKSAGSDGACDACQACPLRSDTGDPCSSNCDTCDNCYSNCMD
jgi:radical SAM protein with 4Fe4S-binding SPASM domain